MSGSRRGTQFALCAGLGLMFAACGSSAAEEGTGAAGSGIPVVGNIPSGTAGQSSGSGFKGWRDMSAAGSSGAAGAAGSSGSAGTALAAGSGGASGSAGGVAGTTAAAGSGATVEPDPLDVFGLGSAGAAAGSDPFDIFNMGNATAPAVSCVGLICAELADCQDLYPDESAACKFTACVDLECK